MTVLNKPVSRRTFLDPRLCREAGDVTVTLYPDNTIGFRKVRHRREVRLPLSHCWSMALKAEALAILKERRARKKMRKP